ncbi:MAG: hypothetical protein WCI52_04190 [bacterium]
MSDIEFEDRSYSPSKRSSNLATNKSGKKSSMVGLLMRYGIKSENAANIILVGVALFFFAASALVLLLFK